MFTDTLIASERNIDVWLAFYDEIGDAGLHAKLRELLTEEERRQELRFYFPKDQRRYLITRALVRTVLSQYVPAVAPSEWVFAPNAYGRPAIANQRSDGHQLFFNISHTHSLIALAITQGRELGVDVENVRARPVSISIADRFFSPVEVVDLARVPPERQQDRFFEYWTFKESYIKARGMGLSIPLDQFSFEYPHERGVRITIQPELRDLASRWCFWQFRPTPEYLLALCAERLDGEMPQLTIRKAVPTVSAELLDLRLRRCSEWT
jgi:4'-phosphopantetheinyl transferase